MASPTVVRSLRGGFHRHRLPYARHALAACSPPVTAREILASWHWVSLEEPPDWLVAVSALATIFFEIWVFLALFFPSLAAGYRTAAFEWVTRHTLILTFGLIMGWGVVYWVFVAAASAVANLSLLLGRSICFPILLISGWGRRVVGCWRVLGRMLDVLSRWLTPDDTIRIFRGAMPYISSTDALKWKKLSPAHTVSRLLESQSDSLLSSLPVAIWPQLVSPALSPRAMGVLFGRSLRHGGSTIQAVSRAVVLHDGFSQPVTGRLLVRELAALPPDRLVAMLELMAEISRPLAGNVLHSILNRVQELGDADTVRRFQTAITLASAQICEDLLVSR